MSASHPRQGPPTTTPADASAVANLVLRERQSRDRGWWDSWAACFADDARIEMSWFTGSADEFVRQTRLRSGGGAWGRHRLSPPAVQVNGDRAWAEAPLGIEFHIHIGGVEADLISYCRSQYRAQRYDGSWRITRITSIYERDCLLPSVPSTTSISTPLSSRAIAPPIGAWPGTSPGTARRSAPTSTATTDPKKSPVSTRQNRPGSPATRPYPFKPVDEEQLS